MKREAGCFIIKTKNLSWTENLRAWGTSQSSGFLCEH